MSIRSIKATGKHSYQVIGRSGESRILQLASFEEQIYRIEPTLHVAKDIQEIGRRAYSQAEWVGHLTSRNSAAAEDIARLIFDERSREKVRAQEDKLDDSVSENADGNTLYLFSRERVAMPSRRKGFAKIQLLRNQNPTKQLFRRITNTEEVFVHDIVVDPGDENYVERSQRKGNGTALLYDGLSRFPYRKPASMVIPQGNIPMEVLAGRAGFEPSSEVAESDTYFKHVSDDILASNGLQRLVSVRSWSANHIGDVIDEMELQFPWLNSKIDLSKLAAISSVPFFDWKSGEWQTADDIKPLGPKGG